MEVENFKITGNIYDIFAQIIHPEYGPMEDFDGIYDEGSYLGKTECGLEVHNVMQKGGGEGGSQHCETVLRFGEDKYLKITYAYYSHEGYCFDYPSLEWVERKTKTIYVY